MNNVISRTLIRKQRLAIADRQITSAGPEGKAGVYCVLYQDQDGQLSFDVRYFLWKQPKGKNATPKHRSTTNGVILQGHQEAYAAAQALVDLIDHAKTHNLIPPPKGKSDDGNEGGTPMPG